MKPTGIYADDQGHLFCDIELADREGTSFASCKVRTAGHTHTGISTFTTNDENLELLEAGGTWDCREWQWWENHGYGTEMRPRHVPATSGYKQESSETYVMSQYVCDGIKTELEWTFPLQDSGELLTYDCRITITNGAGRDLIEYAQFFASYTETNRDKSQFFWAADKTFKTFASFGGKHLDAYIVAPGSEFEKLGKIPHAVKGDGKVVHTWERPVLVGHPTPKGWRHIILTDPAHTAGLASGEGGMAMDYIAYPGDRHFRPGQSFSLRVRHHLARTGSDLNTDLIDTLWNAFEDERLSG